MSFEKPKLDLSLQEDIKKFEKRTGLKIDEKEKDKPDDEKPWRGLDHSVETDIEKYEERRGDNIEKISEEKVVVEAEKEGVEEERGGGIPETEQPEAIDFQNWENFGLSEKELENNIEWFSELSPGQRLLVLENFKQQILGRVQEEAGDKYKKDTGEAKFLGRIWKGISKYYQIAKLKKEGIKEITEGGIDTHGKILSELVRGVREFGPQVIEGEGGELEFGYVNPEDFKKVEDKKRVEEFNKISSAFAKMPIKWGSKYASKEERKKYETVKEDYEKVKEEILNIRAKIEGNEKEAQLYLNEIEAKIHINQNLNFDPKAEEILERIKNKSIWKEVLKDTATERGISAGLGYLTRTVTASVAGAFAVPLVAAGMGGIFARQRAKKELGEKAIVARGEKEEISEKRGVELGNIMREIGKTRSEIQFLYKQIEDQKDRSGASLTPKEIDDRMAELKSKKESLKKLEEKEKEKFLEEKNYVDAKYLYTSLDNMVDDLKNGDVNPRAKEEMQRSLVAHIEDAERKMGDGTVNFGSGDKRLANQYKLIQALSKARTYIVSEELFREDKKDKTFSESYEENKKGIEEVLKKQEKNLTEAEKTHLWNKMKQGAMITGGFALAGYGIRHIGEALGWWGGATEGDKGDGDSMFDKLEEHLRDRFRGDSGIIGAYENQFKGWGFSEDDSEKIAEYFVEHVTSLVKGETMTMEQQEGILRGIEAAKGSSFEDVKRFIDDSVKLAKLEGIEISPEGAVASSVVEDELGKPESIIGTEKQEVAKAAVEAPVSKKEVMDINIKSGDSVWTASEKYLDAKYGENFSGLGGGDENTGEALKTYNIDRVKDKIAEIIDGDDIEFKKKFGLEGIDNIDNVTVEQLKNINFNEIDKDVFGSADGGELTESLSKEEVGDIVENNKKLREFFEKHSDAPRTTENYEAILGDNGDTGEIKKQEAVEVSAVAEPVAVPEKTKTATPTLEERKQNLLKYTHTYLFGTEKVFDEKTAQEVYYLTGGKTEKMDFIKEHVELLKDTEKAKEIFDIASEPKQGIDISHKNVLDYYNMVKDVANTEKQRSLIELFMSPNNEAPKSLEVLLKGSGVLENKTLEGISATVSGEKLIIHYDIQNKPYFDIIINKDGTAIAKPSTIFSFFSQKKFNSLEKLIDILKLPVKA